MLILVTGSGGCIGAAVAARLSAAGHEVVGLDLDHRTTPAGIARVSASVSDAQAIRELFRERPFGAIVHCGGISGAAVAPEDPYRNCETNIFGTVYLLEAARTHRVGRFVFCSSTGAYGSTSGEALTEESLLRPVSVYGATKAACDALVRAYRVQHGLDGISLRIGRVYGPGRRTESVIRDMLEHALRGKRLVLKAGSERRQYVYVDDVVDAVVAALSVAKAPSWVYNVSGPGRYSDGEIAEVVRRLVPSADIVLDAAPGGPPAEPPPFLDYSSAARELGYQPRHTIDAGIAKYRDWLRAQHSI